LNLLLRHDLARPWIMGKNLATIPTSPALHDDNYLTKLLRSAAHAQEGILG
jgi:hypothetical protein